MANEKTLNTRILLKYDSYTNWTTNNPVLKKGEVAIATIASGNTEEVNSVAAPQVLIKVGDGTSTYSQLPFVSAKAADVYSWAKADKKPTYEASEITGIDAYIADYVEEQMGISVDTDTQYQLVKVSDYSYKLQSKGKTDSAWADVPNSVITIPQDDTDTQYKIEKGANDYTYVLKSKGLKDTTWTDVSTFTVPSDDTNTQYSFSLSGYVLTIKKKDIGDTDFVDYKTIDLSSAFNAKADKVAGATAGNLAGLDSTGNLTDSGKKADDFATAAQGDLADSALQKADIATGTTNGTIKVKDGEVKVFGLGSAAYTEASAYAEAEHYHVAADVTDFATEVAKVEVEKAKKADEATKATKDGAGNVIADTYLDKTTAGNTYLSKTDAGNTYLSKTDAGNTYLSKTDAGNTYESQTNAQQKYDELSDAIDNLGSTVGELEEVKHTHKNATTLDGITDDLITGWNTAAEFFDNDTPIGAESEAWNDALNRIDDLESADEDFAKDVEAISGKVTTLIGSDTGKSVRAIAAEEIAEQLIADNAAEALDSLQEIAAWIQSHPNDAAEMNEAISTIQKQLTGIAAGDGTVKKYVDDEVSGLEDKLAKAWDDRISPIEDDQHTHDNKKSLDRITEEKIAAWDAAEQNAKDYADTVVGDAIGDLAAIASTGNVNDLVQTTGDVLIFDCGNSKF